MRVPHDPEVSPMSERLTCPNCGDPLPAGSPRNLCPRCLLQAGLQRDVRAWTYNGGRHSRSVDLTATTGSGVLDSIAAVTGSVPRILLRDTDGGPEPPLHRPAGTTDPWPATRYRIDGEIARGGMGAVLKGRDPDLGRDLAVKVLLEEHRDNPDLVRRFVEEAQIGGQLQHPGIVPVYELGSFADRRPYFTMKLVKGRTLAELARDRGRPRRGPAPVPGDLRGSLPDDGLRPRPRRDPPRPEAVERHGGLLRRGAGDGLGPGQGPAPRRRRRRRPGRQARRRARRVIATARSGSDVPTSRRPAA